MSKKTKKSLAAPTQEPKEFETKIKAPKEEFATSLTPVADAEKKEDTAEEKKEETPNLSPPLLTRRRILSLKRLRRLPIRRNPRLRPKMFLPRTRSKMARRQRSRKIRSPRVTKRLPSPLRRAAAMLFSVLASP